MDGDPCANVEEYHAVSDGGASGVDTSDWIWIPECPVGSNPTSAFSPLNCFAICGRPPSVCFEPRIHADGH